MKTTNRLLSIAAIVALAVTVRADRNDSTQRGNGREHGVPTQHNEATVAQLQAEMASGKLSSEQLTREYLARVAALDQGAEGVNAIIELNPDALDMAKNADKLRKQGKLLSPLHGIPVS
jgi:amidase